MLRTPSAPVLAYQTFPNPGKPRVLLVMGFGMRGAVWRPQVDGLAVDHELAWFDNRGIGESEPAQSAFRMADLARDALRIADTLGWDRFHLVGVSLGGMICQEVALLASERLFSLTLIATHGGGLLGIVPTLPGLFHWVNAAFGPAKRRVHHLTRLLYPPEFLDTVDRALLTERMQLQVGTPPPRRTALYQLRAVILHKTLARLRALQVPTLVVKSAADKLVRPLHSDRLHAAIPHSRLHVVAGAGHGLTFHAANEVNAAIRGHVAAYEPAAR